MLKEEWIKQIKLIILMIHKKKRILIIGNSGSGKSTFSKVLGDRLGLNVYHLDRYFWKPGWVESKKDEWTEKVEELISKDEWIIEGNYTRTLKMRALRSDLIYFFDFHNLFCLYRIYKRVLKSKLKLEIRNDMADGCDERWPDIDFLKFVARFNKRTRPRVISILEEINYNPSDLIIFKSRKVFKDHIINSGTK